VWSRNEAHGANEECGVSCDDGVRRRYVAGGGAAHAFHGMFALSDDRFDEYGAVEALVVGEPAARTAM
jgi:hypothetical protein